MEDNFVNEILELHKKKQWLSIVNKYHNHPDRNKLLWVYPSEDNFEFLKTTLRSLRCDKVLSVGCGSGLLEWMIIEATGLHVDGLEVDGAWWDCKYAPPTFIHLSFAQSELEKDTINVLRQAKCLLFCYFNNRPAFENYMRHFGGNALVVIGPGEHKGVHTDPRPFDDVGKDWLMHSWQEVRNSKDFIAIYHRQ